MVAGNRTREYTVAILSRLVLIAVGACICFIINLCIYPIWAGDDLHRLVVNNFKELATSLEGLIYANSQHKHTFSPQFLKVWQLLTVTFIRLCRWLFEICRIQ